MQTKLVCDMFGGEGAEAYNALMSSLINAAEAYGTKDNDSIYTYLEGTPKTSLICELVDGLKELGFTIQRIK